MHKLLTLVVDDGIQPPVELSCKERNILAATFIRSLHKNIGNKRQWYKGLWYSALIQPNWYKVMHRAVGNYLIAWTTSIKAYCAQTLNKGSVEVRGGLFNIGL